MTDNPMLEYSEAVLTDALERTTDPINRSLILDAMVAKGIPIPSPEDAQE